MINMWSKDKKIKICCKLFVSKTLKKYINKLIIKYLKVYIITYLKQHKKNVLKLLLQKLF